VINQFVDPEIECFAYGFSIDTKNVVFFARALISLSVFIVSYLFWLDNKEQTHAGVEWVCSPHYGGEQSVENKNMSEPNRRF